jgi:hypothetical protein
LRVLGRKWFDSRDYYYDELCRLGAMLAYEAAQDLKWFLTVRRAEHLEGVIL